MTNITERASFSDPSSHSRAMLIVDDSPAVTHALSRILDAAGYRAVPCLTMAEAITWMHRHSQWSPPAAVIVDIHLSDGSGLDLAREAKRILPSTPVLVISGDTSIENLRALPDSGATLFLAKPVHVPTLLEQIRALTTQESGTTTTKHASTDGQGTFATT